MKSPAHDTALWLVANEVGALAGQDAWGIFVSDEPAEPDSVITLYDAGGEGRDTHEQDIQRAMIQVRVRSDDYAAAISKQEEIRTLLTESGSISMDTSDVAGIIDTSDILSIGKDENNRHILVVNYRIIRTEKE